MKVLHVTPSLSPHLGGPTEVILQTVKRLRDLGVDAEIITTDHGIRHDIAPYPRGVLTEYKNIPVRFFNASRIQLNQYIPSLSMWSWLKENCRAYDILDLHYLFTFSTSVAARIAYEQGVPYTVRLMGQLEPWSLQQSPIRKKLYSRFVDKNLFRRAAFIQCTSPGEVTTAEKFGLQAKAVSVPLGVHENVRVDDAKRLLRRELDISESSFVLLYLSRLHKKKRPELCIELLHELPNAHLVFAGIGQKRYLNSLIKHAHQQGVSKRTHFLEHIEGERKAQVLQGADVVLLLSHSENFGLVAAEAMCAGTPPLITPDVGVSFWLERVAPELVSSPCLESLIPVLIRLRDDSSYYQSLSNRLRDFGSEELSWSASTNMLMGHYVRATAKRAH